MGILVYFLFWVMQDLCHHEEGWSLGPEARTYEPLDIQFSTTLLKPP